MKKLLFGASAALMFMACACSTANEENKVEEFVADKQLSDSASIMYGKIVGSYTLSDFQKFEQDMQTADVKNDMLKGLRMVMASGDSKGVRIGMQLGVAMLGEIEQFEAQGIDIDKNAVLKYFMQEFDKDSVDMTNVMDYGAKFRSIMENVQAQKQAFEDSKAAEEPVAVQNGLAGKAYIDKLKAEDPEIKTSESGLSYKITNPGEPAEITDNTTLTVKYRGLLTDGTVFDESTEEGANFSPAGVIPGFAEGLKMLGKGGVATLYIPGELAYGVNGIPQAGIGPNQTLIFEIEILDVN